MLLPSSATQNAAGSFANQRQTGLDLQKPGGRENHTEIRKENDAAAPSLPRNRETETLGTWDSNWFDMSLQRKWGKVTKRKRKVEWWWSSLPRPGSTARILSNSYAVWGMLGVEVHISVQCLVGEGCCQASEITTNWASYKCFPELVVLQIMLEYNSHEPGT